MPFLASNTDDAWEAFDAKDPYYGVLAKEAFRFDAIGDAELFDFFDSGRQHILTHFARIEALVGPVQRGSHRTGLRMWCRSAYFTVGF